jgi:hypothetical protein
VRAARTKARKLREWRETREARPSIEAMELFGRRVLPQFSTLEANES